MCHQCHHYFSRAHIGFFSRVAAESAVFGVCRFLRCSCVFRRGRCFCVVRYGVLLAAVICATICAKPNEGIPIDTQIDQCKKKIQELGTSVLQIFHDKHIKGTKQRKLLQTKRNRYLSKTRYVVEQSFGTLHRKFRYTRAAYFGLLKVSAQSHLKAMCLNLLKAANRLSVPVAA